MVPIKNGLGARARTASRARGRPALARSSQGRASSKLPQLRTSCDVRVFCFGAAPAAERWCMLVNVPSAVLLWVWCVHVTAFPPPNQMDRRDLGPDLFLEQRLTRRFYLRTSADIPEQMKACRTGMIRSCDPAVMHGIKMRLCLLAKDCATRNASN